MTYFRELLFVLIALTVIPAQAASWHDDSHYVSLGTHRGYFLVRPGSPLSHRLGLEAAPTMDTADPIRHGYGADALAFWFRRDSVLASPPAYIAQAETNEFYIRRIGSLVPGRSRAQDVKALFGRPQSTEKKVDGFIAYYTIEIYNSFEDRSGNGRR